MKKEIKKVEKLINKKGYIPVLSGNDILTKKQEKNIDQNII